AYQQWLDRGKTYAKTRGGKALRDMLVKDLREAVQQARVVLLLQDIDAAPDGRVRSWVEGVLLGGLSEGQGQLKVVLTRAAPPAAREPAHYERFDVGPITEGDLADVFKRTHGYGDDEAKGKAREMIAATGGRLVNLLSWFEQVRSNSWRPEK